MTPLDADRVAEVEARIVELEQLRTLLVREVELLDRELELSTEVLVAVLDRN